MDWLKKNWLWFLGVAVVLFVVYSVSLKAGAILAGAASFFGFGGRGAVRKVKARAEKKAKAIRDRGPDAVIDDINDRISK